MNISNLTSRLKAVFSRQSLAAAAHSAPGTVVINLLWVYVLYFICRLVFLWINYGTLSGGLTFGSLVTMFRGGFLFDTSAICYTNSLYILLVLLPLHLKERRWWATMTKWIYVIVNSLCMLLNLGDTVFFEFRHQRVTSAVLREFGGEGNLCSIVGTELLSHWYLVVLFALMVWSLIRFFRRPALPAPGRPLWRYYVSRTFWLALAGLLAVCGMRGNVFFLSATRPISINYAFRYTLIPEQTGLVLNTPFSMIRTIGQSTIPTPHYFATGEELAAVYSPLHTPSATAVPTGKNIVILIVESFAQEFIGALNSDLDGGTYKGYTPYMDAMLDSCMYFDQMIANTYYSIDAPPAVLASIPRAERPFVVSPHSINHINSIATELKKIGYTSAFFHGADNESLGFHAFTRQAGSAAAPNSTAPGASGTSRSSSSSAPSSARCRSPSSAPSSPSRATIPSRCPKNTKTALSTKAPISSTNASATPTIRSTASLRRPAGSRGSTTPYS